MHFTQNTPTALPFEKKRNKDQSQNGHTTASNSSSNPGYDRLPHQEHDQDLLVQGMTLLTSCTIGSEALQQMLTLLRERLWLAGAAIYSLTADERELQCVAESSSGPPGPGRTLSLDKENPVTRAAKTLESVYATYPEESKHSAHKAPTGKSEYAVPLIVRSRLRGVLGVRSDSADGIEQGARALIDQFGVLAALAVELSSHDQDGQELFQTQKLQALGMLAGGVAHDFNNALEVIVGFASLARMRLQANDPLHEPIRIIEDSAQGAASLARQLLEISKEDQAEETLVDITEVIQGVLRIITRTFDRKIRIEHHAEPGLPHVKGFAHRLEQAVLNLCLNARDAMNGAGRLVLEARSEKLALGDFQLQPSQPPGDYVQISVRDTGTGISPEVMKRLFDPLFTTKKPGKGSGLGLTMVNRIVKDAGGFISLKSEPGEGTEFTLYLPATASASVRSAPKASKNLMPGRGMVLVVDDEPRIMEFLEKGLTRLGYSVLAAESGKRACEIYAQQAGKIQCVLLDMIMPEMSGLETYARLREINPNVRVILSSGYSSGRVPRQAAEAGGAEFLGKPYTLEALSHALQKPQQN